MGVLLCIVVLPSRGLKIGPTTQKQMIFRFVFVKTAVLSDVDMQTGLILPAIEPLFGQNISRKQSRILSLPSENWYPSASHELFFPLFLIHRKTTGTSSGISSTSDNGGSLTNGPMSVIEKRLRLQLNHDSSVLMGFQDLLSKKKMIERSSLRTECEAWLQALWTRSFDSQTKSVASKFHWVNLILVIRMLWESHEIFPSNWPIKPLHNNPPEVNDIPLKSWLLYKAQSCSSNQCASQKMAIPE